jgi:cation:H+ antiporter
MTYLTILAGLVLLVVGGELLVRGAVATALRFGVSAMVIGLTLVGFGTSTPELVTSLEAAFLGAPGIAVGNVVGSNTANILLILGLAAAITPIGVDRATLRRDGTVVMLAALACLAAVLSGDVGRVAGAILVTLLAGYVYYTYRHPPPPAARPEDPALVPGPAPQRLATGLILFAAGLALTILGADLLVGGAIELARAWQVSDVVIGVTIVAIGTSLPELVTSITAAVRKQPDIALGNIIGSNIFNVLGILGVTALVHPVEVPAAILALDIWAMLGATVLLLVCAATGARLSRGEGGLFLAAYAAYLVVLIE